MREGGGRATRAGQAPPPHGYPRTGQAHSCSFPRPSELFSHQNPKSLDKREDPSQHHGGHGVQLNEEKTDYPERRPSQASRAAQLVKDLLAMQKTWV